MVNEYLYASESEIASLMGLSGLPNNFVNKFTIDYATLKVNTSNITIDMAAINAQITAIKSDIVIIKSDITTINNQIITINDTLTTLENNKQDNIQFKNNGVNNGTAGEITAVEFVGASVTKTGSLLQIPLPEKVNAITVGVDFGSSFSPLAKAVVTGQSWVTATSKIIPEIKHSNADEAYLLDMNVIISDIIPNIGFTVTVVSKAWAKGVYTVMCLGI